MPFKIAIAVCGMLCVAQAAFAQNAATRYSAATPQAQQRFSEQLSDSRTFEGSLANLTVKAAFAPAALSPQQALGLWLLMSVPRNGAFAKDSMKQVMK